MATAETQQVSESPFIWDFDIDAIDQWHYDTKVMQKHPGTIIINERQYAKQDYLLAQQYGMINANWYPVPTDMLPLVLNYPSMNGFLPDLFRSTGLLLCASAGGDGAASRGSNICR